MRVLALLVLLGSPVAAEELRDFQSPSGNIHCLMINGVDVGVRCDMAELTPSFTKRPPDCEADWGSAFWIGSKGPGVLACVSDTVINPSAPVLGYGSTLSFASMTCTSERTGVTCTNTAGHGFRLSRAVQELF
jgi:hypothetical protein